MGKHYEVLYWGYNENDGTSCTELRLAVTIPDATMKMLLAGTKVAMYHFIIGEGQDWFLPSDQLCEIRELLEYTE